jgi:hypothetical protein
MDEQRESCRRHNVISGKWKEEESEQKMKELDLEAAKNAPVYDNDITDKADFMEIINFFKNIHSPSTLFDKEYYFAILMDRKYGGPVLVASTQGGMDIEEVAEKNPSAIVTQPVDITTGLLPAQADALALKLGFSGALAKGAAAQFHNVLRRIHGLVKTVEVHHTQHFVGGKFTQLQGERLGHGQGALTAHQQMRQIHFAIGGVGSLILVVKNIQVVASHTP